jgi:hypothetical protein
MNRDRRSFTRGGGWLALFGFPFFAAGLLGMILPAAEGAEPAWLAAVVSLPFALIGAAFIFGRIGVTIDRRRRTVSRWWGALLPFRSAVYGFDDFQLVSISLEICRAKNATHTFYPVCIEGRPPMRIQLSRHGDYVASRRIAEEAAKLMNLGVADRTSGQEILREAGTLDEPFRQRARRTGQTFVPREPPADTRLKLERSSRTATFDLPPPGVRASHVASVATVLIAGVAVYFLGVRNITDGAPEEFVWFLHGIFALGFGGGLIFLAFRIAIDATMKERIEATLGSVKLTRISFLGSRGRQLSADRIEEIEVGPTVLGGLHTTYRGREVVGVRSDQATLEFGAGLSRAELDWVRETICSILTSG